MQLPWMMSQPGHPHQMQSGLAQPGGRSDREEQRQLQSRDKWVLRSLAFSDPLGSRGSRDSRSALSEAPTICKVRVSRPSSVKTTEKKQSGTTSTNPLVCGLGPWLRWSPGYQWSQFVQD